MYILARILFMETNALLKQRKVTSNSPQTTKEIAIKVAKSLKGGGILALTGDLGAGKTCFTQGLAEGLSIKEKITSPTFVLMKQYKVTSHQPALPRGRSLVTSLVHIDAYRMRSERDVLEIGVTDYLADPDTICVIEWPERIKKILPKNTIWIEFKHIDENKRQIIINDQVTSDRMMKKQILRAIVFDFDQVIGNSINVGVSTHQTIARKLKLRIPRVNEIKKIWDEPWSKIITTLWPDVDVNYVKNRFNELIEYIFPLISGAKQTLQYLKKKKTKVLILTAGDQKYFKKNLKRLKIDRYIDFIFATGENKIHKPDKRVFQSILRYLSNNNIGLNESLYIGDSPRKDYSLAKKVGIPFVAATTGYFKKKDFLKVGLAKNRVIKSIKELPKWLKRNYDLGN